MDVLVEQIVKKKHNGMDYLIFIGTGLAALAFLASCFLIGSIKAFSVTFPLVFILFMGAFLIIMSRRVEFEYSIKNGNVTIDKLINQSKRESIIAFSARTVEEMGKYDEEKHQSKNYDKRLFTCVSAKNKESWYMTFHTEKTGYTLLVFTPNEKVLAAIKSYLSVQVKYDTFGRFDFTR